MRPEIGESSKHPSSEFLRKKLQTKRSQASDSQASTHSSLSSQDTLELKPFLRSKRDSSSLDTPFSSCAPSIHLPGTSKFSSTAGDTPIEVFDSDDEDHAENDESDSEISSDSDEEEPGDVKKTAKTTIYTARDGTEKTRFRPGVQALREIRYFQKKPHLLLLRAPFARLVRQITRELKGGKPKTDLKYTRSAMEALQEATELYIVQHIEDSNLLAIHDRRVTIMPRDMQRANQIRGKRHRN